MPLLFFREAGNPTLSFIYNLIKGQNMANYPAVLQTTFKKIAKSTTILTF